MTVTNYAYTVTLLDRSASTRTPISQSADSTHAAIVSGDITSWVVRIEYENTGIKKTNNAEISFRMDSLGTFFRTNPNFFTAAAKTKYLIELQISQVINGVTKNGKIFRGEIGEPSIQEDESVGELIRLPLRDIAYSTKEVVASGEDIFTTPYERFLNLIQYYANETATPPVGKHDPSIDLGFGSVNLPDDESLRQNWTPNDPTYVHDLMEEVINRLASPSSQGGTFTDYYFDFDPNPSTTLLSTVSADIFGNGASVATINSDSIDSGNPSVLQEKSIINDNTRYKNNCILVCHPSAGTLPMDLCKFASNWAHGTVRPEWSSSGVYTAPSTTTQASLVKVTNLSDPDMNKRIRFFTCKVNVGPTGTSPISDPTHWTEDFSTNPSSPAYINYTPWTNLTEFTSNMAGITNIPFGYAGYFYDYNIARALYDPTSRTDPSNAFQNVSIKFVTRVDNNVPTDPTEMYNGQRILVGPSPTGAFSGHANQVAQLDLLGSGGWQFSNSPSPGDTVYDMEMAQVLSYNPPASTWNGNDPDTGISYVKGDLVKWLGLIYQCKLNIPHSIFNTNPASDTTHWLLRGNWVPVWGHDSVLNWDINADKGGSPFHPAATLQTVTGATGVPNAALRATYNWVDEALGGQFINRASRGVWLSFMFPFPRISNANGVCGHVYGGGGNPTASTPPLVSTFDSNNLNYTRNGNIGWNIGTESEDLGKISGIHFKMKVGLFASAGTDESQPVDFIADIPMTFWAVDLFDRVYYYDFKLRRNNQWELVEIPFGYSAPQQLYFSRGDELPKLLQYTLPWDFTLKEKEYTGVQFDWKYVKGFGFQMKQPYTSQSGMYMAGQDPFFGEMLAGLQQLGADIYNAIADPISKALFNEPAQINTFVNHAAISIDELCFTKELIVNSDDSIVPFSRTKVDFRETEQDYLSAKSQARGEKYRGIFYPQFWHIRSKGDVRLQFGKNFTVVGSRVPNGTLTLAIQSVKHIIDHDGYNVEVMGVNKFDLQTNAIDYQYYDGA